MAKLWSRGAMLCTLTRPRCTPTPSRPRTASGARSPPGTGEAAPWRRLCLRLFPCIALRPRADTCQALVHAIALHGCLVQVDTQARPFGRDEAAILQRRHAL